MKIHDENIALQRPYVGGQSVQPVLDVGSNSWANRFGVSSIATIYARVALASALVGAVAGKATLGRLSEYVSVAADLEVRSIALALTVLALLASYFTGDKRQLARQVPFAILVGGAWVLFVVYHWWAASHVWTGPGSESALTDLGYFAAFVAVCALAASSEPDIKFSAVVLEGAALVLLIASALTLGPKTYAYNFGEFGTTITNYRIYGTGLCCACYLMMGRTTLWQRLAHFGLGAVFCYACLGSTSKTSIIAIVAVAGTILLAAVIQGMWRHLLIITCVGLVGLAIFAGSMQSSALERRLAVVSATASSSRVEGVRQDATCKVNSTYALLGPADVRDDSCSGMVIISDMTQRIRLGLHAMHLFSGSPLWGSGPGSYHLLIADPETKPTVYRYPHNIYLEVASNYGLVGLSFLALAVLVTIFVFARSAKIDFNCIYIMSAPVLYLAGSATGGDIYDARVAWVITAVVAGAYGMRLMRKGPRKRRVEI